MKKLLLFSIISLAFVASVAWAVTVCIVPQGCTGVGTFTDGGILSGNGTGAIQVTAVLTEGQLLIGDGTTEPSIAAMSGDATMASTGVLTISANAVVLTTDTTGNYVSSATASGGLVFAGSEGGSLGLLTSCANNEILKWATTGSIWQCATDATGAGGGDSVTVNSTAATDANFLDNTSIQWGIDTAATPDNITATTIDLFCTNCIGPTEITDLTLGTDTAGSYAAGDAEAGAALTGDSATAFFTLGAIELARGGTGASLVDPNADRIMFWDDSVGVVDWLAVDTTLSITATTVSVVDLICTNCIGPTEISDLTLGTDTAGNYLATLTGDVGVDTTGATTGEGIAHGLSFDATELTALTWSAAGSASFVWTFDLSGTDPTLTATSSEFFVSKDFGVDNQGDLKFYEDDLNGANFVAFQSASSVTSNVTWTWPTADGTADQVLHTNAAGVLRWDVDDGAGASPWTTDVNVVNLNTDTDTVTIGSATNLGKLAVDGDADEIQLLVQGFSTQTTSLIVAENSAGTDQLTLSNAGVLTLGTDLAVTEGGTGVGTFTDAGVLIGNGTGAIQVTSAGTSGQVLTSNGAGVDPTFQASAAGVTVVFTRFTTASTWTKAASVKSVYLECFGAGGGGGGGLGNASTTVARVGGGGGGGGSRVFRMFPASTLSATTSVTIGAGGTAGTGGSAAAGVDGTAGGNSTFGTYLTAYGGGFGNGDSACCTNSNGGGGGGGSGEAGLNPTGATGGSGGGPGGATGVGGNDSDGLGGGKGGSAAIGGNSAFGGAGGGGSTANGTVGKDAGSSSYGGAAGGSGGGVTSANVESAGGAGGASPGAAVGGGGAGGAANGGAGTAGTQTVEYGGSGGGGGGGQGSGTGGGGGAGGVVGGGGGGGGGGTSVGGAGGAGGRGECRVWEW